ncbi:MAG: putative signal transducing protein [Thermoleophilia bacterium]
MSDEIVLLKRYPSEMDAIFARSVLESESIQSVIFKDDAGGMEPQFQLTQGVRLMIRAEDLERARELIGEIDVR